MKSEFTKDYSEFFKDIEVNRECDKRSSDIEVNHKHDCDDKNWSDTIQCGEVNHKRDCDDFSPEFQACIPEDNHKRDCEED